jgi:hypothetical protein
VVDEACVEVVDVFLERADARGRVGWKGPEDDDAEASGILGKLEQVGRGPCCWGMEEGVWSTLTRIDHCGGRCNVDEATAVADAEADVEVDAGRVRAVEELVRVDRGRACKVFRNLS